MSLENILLVVAGTLTTLLAGLFYGYTVSVNRGLHRLKDVEYIRAMQSINIVIQNPLFFLTFLGPVVLLPVVTFLHRSDADPARFMLLLAASVAYIAGSFVVTIVGNVPLNERLAKFSAAGASDIEMAKTRSEFEKPWNRLHNIRTLASVAASILIFIACLA